MKKLKALVVCKYHQDSQESKIFRGIESEEIEIKYSWKNKLLKEDLDGVDFVVAIGGDGTALSASHFLVGKPLLAVNSDPAKSEGALTTISLNELKDKLEEIKNGNYKTEKLERIEVLINEEKQNILALNEVFIANEKTYLSSKYHIKYLGGGSKIEEDQISSGLLFSTGTGSTAWFKSAGGQPFAADEKYIKMIVREPYIRKILRFSMLEKTIHDGDSITVIPYTNSILAIDSIREIKLKKGDEVKIEISKWPLLRIK